MRTTRLAHSPLSVLPHGLGEGLVRRARDLVGMVLLAGAVALGVALSTWSVRDPSLSHATAAKARNALGYPGAVIADLGMQLFGIGSVAVALAFALIGLRLIWLRQNDRLRVRVALAVAGVFAAATFASALPPTARWPLPTGLGGAIGDALLGFSAFIGMGSLGFGRLVAGLAFGLLAILAFSYVGRGTAGPAAIAPERDEDADTDEPSVAILLIGALMHWFYAARGALGRLRLPQTPAEAPTLSTRLGRLFATMKPSDPAPPAQPFRREPTFAEPGARPQAVHADDEVDDFEPAPPAAPIRVSAIPAPDEALPEVSARVTAPAGALKPGKRASRGYHPGP